jgi:phage terminase large subunit
MIINDLIDVARMKQRVFNVKLFFCDPSRPDSIEAFNRAGLTSVPADNQKRAGIDAQYELIKTNRFRIFDTCKHTLDEIASYHYPEPKEAKPDDKRKDVLPVEQNDHAMDAMRYCTMGILTNAPTRKPAIQQSVERMRNMESPAQRIRRLQKPSTNRHTENW